MRYSQLAVDNEVKKYRLGFSTLIDVINFQDRLTSANQSYINNLKQHMAAVAQLRFEVGRLTINKGTGGSYTLEQFTTIPRLDTPAD